MTSQVYLPTDAACGEFLDALLESEITLPESEDNFVFETRMLQSFSVAQRIYVGALMDKYGDQLDW